MQPSDPHGDDRPVTAAGSGPAAVRRRVTWVLRRLAGGAEAWRHPDFVRLWAGQSISQTGSQVTAIALPLIAVDTLHASASTMGVLTAAGRLPYLLYMVAGVWVDRVRRRRLLLGTDLARGTLLLAVPLAAAAHVLSLWVLGTVLVAAVTLSVWFDTAYMSYLPLLIDRRLLLQGNTIVESTSSAAQVVGSSLGGLLVQAISAPGAVIADALSFFASALSLWRIRHPDPAPDPAATGRLSLRELIAGMRPGIAFVARHPILRPLALAIGLSNAAWAAELALYVLYLARGLGLSPALIGLTLAAGGPGALVGSALAGRVQRRIGVSGAVIGGLSVFALAALLIPLAPGGDPAVAVPLLMVAAFGMPAGGQVCAVNVLTTRQLLSPEPLLGRVNASFRFAGLGVSPLGALLGGTAGSAIGLRTALLAAVGGMLLAPLIVAVSPVRRLHDLPAQAGAA
jgi:predicted MFS family arabinose efflux permease